jgi:hypothetical protein
MAAPDVLECPPEAQEAMARIERLARRGQHILTRREILKYVTSDAGTRAQEIQQLLNISDVERVRQGLVTTANQLRGDAVAADRDLQREAANLSGAVGLSRFDEIAALTLANEKREVLGASRIDVLESGRIKSRVAQPAIPEQAPVNIEVLRSNVATLQGALESENDVVSADREIRDVIRELGDDRLLDTELKALNLVSLGLQLLDPPNRCPLCGLEWDPAQLRHHLQERHDRAGRVRDLRTTLTRAADRISNRVGMVRVNVERISLAASRLNRADVQTFCLEWIGALQRMTDGCANPLVNYSAIPKDLITKLGATPDAMERVSAFMERLEREVTPLPPTQSAWDVLTLLESHLRNVEVARENSGSAQRAATRAAGLLDSFERARDLVLQDLYDEIRDRFVELYNSLHEHEADHFSAAITPDGAGLKFEVDFLGHGTHPPHALHSEGHQDSMGLCLFLALSEHLSGNLIDLIVLDDVVMSVDAEHRREICGLLCNQLGGKQFIITTHDKNWANQLRTTGVVQSSHLHEFSRWSLEAGPSVGQILDLWESIDDAFARGDTPGAAHKLRRGSEQFFEMVCDALAAPVPYRSDGRWELGDWIPSATQRLKELIKQGKRAAQSWGNVEQRDALDQFDSIRAQVHQSALIEQWAVNAQVHYSNWINLTEPELRPVVDAFRALFGLFQCATCGQLLKVTRSSYTDAAVACPCGKVNWNLQEQ